MRKTRATAAFGSTFYELLQRPIFRRRCKDRAGDGGRAGSFSARSTPSCPTAPAFTKPASKDRAQEPRGALAEAYDSGLPEAEYRTFAGDLDNLTIAAPSVNRNEKSDRDAGDWMPEMNQGWFAATVVAVKQKYQLSVNPAERDALVAMLGADSSRTVMCGTEPVSALPFLTWTWEALIDRFSSAQER